MNASNKTPGIILLLIKPDGCIYKITDFELLNVPNERSIT
jgi:hypothetical protein